ncbi:MAG: hypothetical protein HFI68_11360 [Lachnospiraceae bacterium]|nr:hypothetical protein [Lachnospiraceae bacterium]
MKIVKTTIGLFLAATLLFSEVRIPAYAEGMEETELETVQQEEMSGENWNEESAASAGEVEFTVQTESADGTGETEKPEATEPAEGKVEPESVTASEPETEAGLSEEGQLYAAGADQDSLTVMNPDNKLSITVEYPRTISCGTETVFKMSASGGTGNYKYRIYGITTYDASELVNVYDISKNNNSAYSYNNEFRFSFTASGTYYIRFNAMDMGTNQTVDSGSPRYGRQIRLDIQDPAYPSVEEKAKQLVEECLQAGCTTDYEKALWLHDWIVTHMEYDNSLKYCSAEGALTRGEGTCDAYHRGYVMLLKKAGIPTGRIEGNGHVWTAVKMDGKWYQVDTTWDDAGDKYQGTYRQYMYFGLTDYITGLVHSDHQSAVAGYESTSLENNYFIKSGEITKWSDPFVSSISQNLAAGQTKFILDVTRDKMPISSGYIPDPHNKNVLYNLVAYYLSQQDWNGSKISVSYKDEKLTVIKGADAYEPICLKIVPPAKTVYEKGEAVNKTGLTVTAYYAGGTKVRKLNDGEYKVNGFDTNTVGTRTATVTAGEESASFTYTVKESQNTGGNGGQTGTAKAASVSYRTHIQSVGWQGFKKDGAMSGTSGMAKRLEGIEIKLDTKADLGIQYTTHCQSYGWLPWSANGEMNGTSGEAKRLEAIKIQLTGADKNLYDIYYRVHAQSYGWLNWAKNGEASGTAGYGKRLEGIQIVIVEKGKTFNRNMQGISSNTSICYASLNGGEPAVSGAGVSSVKYRTHIQSVGWQGWKKDGAMSGTSGISKRLEGIEIQLSNRPYQGGITYRTHIQSIGWQGWKADGAMSGTSGQSKRLEAIEIKLTGVMAQKYDIYYRVHAQSYGWLGWAKNGAPAGTAGYGKRLEGIEIRLVPKGGKAPGSTVRPFVEK